MASAAQRRALEAAILAELESPYRSDMTAYTMYHVLEQQFPRHMISARLEALYRQGRLSKVLYASNYPPPRRRFSVKGAPLWSVPCPTQ